MGNSTDSYRSYGNATSPNEISLRCSKIFNNVIVSQFADVVWLATVNIGSSRETCMNESAIGRNDPCPCGSGLKFKKCCQLNGQPAATERGATAVSTMLREALQGQQFGSMAEVQAFIDSRTQNINQRPVDEFQGLSPEQMHHFLHFPFSSPGLIDVPDILSAAPSAQVARLFSMMADAIGEKGIKTTAKGNLPRQFCRDAADACRSEQTKRGILMSRSISSEEDFFDLHVTRLLAGFAGLIRKYKGKFILSRQCKALLASHGMTAIYPRLFKAYIEQFNWGYRDGYPELHIIQRASFYSLYLLTQFGGEWRSPTHYGDCFLRAFPDVLDEAPSDEVFRPEEMVRNCYSLRTIHNFIGFFGLGAVEPVSKESFSGEYRVTSMPLLRDAVRFHIAK